MIHRRANVVSNYIRLLNEVCRKNDLLSVIHGKVHEYLGIVIDFWMKEQVVIS